MGFESESSPHVNPVTISDVVKKLLTTFFSANITFTRGLDIYGSIHVRSDDYDVVCCVLNEHCLKPDKATNSDEKQSAPLLPGTVSSQSCSAHSNTTSSNEYLSDWQRAGLKKSCGKKSVSGQEECKEQVGVLAKDGETPAKRRKLPGLSRKLSKLNKASLASMNYSAQSVFPEPLAFGSGDVKNSEVEKFHLESLQGAKHGSVIADDTLESDPADKSTYRSEDQSNSDDPSIDLAMVATSEVDTPHKSSTGFDNEGEMVDFDSADSDDFDPVDKGGSYPFGSHQSFNHHSTPFSSYGVPPVGFSETEIFSQSGWLPSDGNTRGGNQPGCSSSSFDGSTRPPGPLTSEKICMYCLKIFHTNLEMSHHIQHQHNSGFPLLDNNDERPYRPRYQNAYAYGGSELDVDRQLTCSVCSLSFRSLDGLRCHENSKHSRNKLYKCQFCTQSFLTRQAAYTHRMKFHRLSPRNSQLLAGAMAHI